MEAPDPCRCPLCGQPNACAMAAPAPAAATGGHAQQLPCWCTRITFSAELLRQVPAAARHKACICAACVAATDGLAQDPSAGEGA